MMRMLSPRFLHHSALAVLVLFAPACDCSGGSGGGVGDVCASSTDCRTGLDCIDSVCTARPDAGDSIDASPTGCPAARACGAVCCASDETCGGGRCCAPSELCGGACCGASQVCEADRCVLSCGDAETPCGTGTDAVCCAPTDLCYLGACTTPGDPCTSTRDCPDGSYCESTAMRCLPRAMGEACEYMPPVAMFETTEEWSWPVGGTPAAMPTHDQVMMAPMVANLTDDDGDGLIDQNDVPDVVFHTFAGSNYRADGILRAIRGNDGTEIWPTGDPGYRTSPGGEIAIAELDAASEGPEILACSPSNSVARTPGHLMLLSAAGTLIRRFDTAPNDVPCGYDAPAVADMNRDGVPEIVVRHVIAHADGTVLQRIRDDRASASGSYNTLADVDGDMDLELVSSNGVYRYDGTTVWERTVDMPSRPLVPVGHVAIADLDLDTNPEIVIVASGTHAIWALDAATGDTVWGPIDVNPPELAADVAANGNPAGGGPPTIANFDGDPNPEIAFAGGFAYVVFEHDGTRAWYFVTQDRSSRSTGSSIFDFEGDGLAEVLYNDELFMRVFRGTDGMVLYDRCNLSGTLREYPIVVDVDNDDHAEIVLMENNYAFGGVCTDGTPARTGIHAFGHPRNEWVRTRRIWNQHTYHVTNVDENGAIPRMESPNWTAPRLNNFRQNVQPDGIFDAPDLVVVDLYAGTDACPTELALSVRVLNRGAAGAPAGIPVTFYDVTGGARTRLGTEHTTRPLLPGESELVVLSTPFAIPAGREADTFMFEAVVNDPTDMPDDTLHECRLDNNTTGAVEVYCPIIM